MTRAASEPYRRHVGGVTWTRDDAGRYSTTEGAKHFVLLPGKSGRSGSTGYSLSINGESVGGSGPLPGLRRCLQEAGRLVRRERAENDLSLASSDVKYPEMERYEASKDKLLAAVELLAWLQSQDVHVFDRFRSGDQPELQFSIALRYCHIDPAKLEQERNTRKSST